MDLNQFQLIGRLTRDAEIKSTPNGVTVANLSIANNQKVKKNGQWQDVANYFNVSLFGQSASNLAQYLTKGKQIAISGVLRQNRWTDQSGNNHSQITLVAQSVQLLGGSQAPQNTNGTRQNNGYRQNTQQQQQFQQDMNAMQDAGLIDDEPPLWEEIQF